MNKAPQVGARVRYSPPSNNYGVREPVEGTVVGIFPKELPPSPDWDWNRPDSPPFTGMAPEADWGTCVLVDSIPKWWPYGPDFKRFFPSVSELEPC